MAHPFSSTGGLMALSLLLTAVPISAADTLTPECRAAVSVVTAASAMALMMSGQDAETKDRALALTLDMDSVIARSCGMSPEDAHKSVQTILKTTAPAVVKPPRTRITQEQFDNSKVGSMYTCKEIASKTARTKAVSTFARGIAYIRSQDPSVDNLHEDYATMAKYQTLRIESEGSADNFYRFACSEVASNIERSIANGTIK